MRSFKFHFDDDVLSYVSAAKTGTGTVIIQVEDVNDNVPIILPPGERVICEKEGELGSVVLVAEDMDEAPFKGPFTFSLPDDKDGKWSVTRFNGRCSLSFPFRFIHAFIMP